MSRLTIYCQTNSCGEFAAVPIKYYHQTFSQTASVQEVESSIIIIAFLALEKKLQNQKTTLSSLNASYISFEIFHRLAVNMNPKI